MPDSVQEGPKRCVMHTEKIHELELSVVEMKGDVKHIREKIDNGLSSTVNGLNSIITGISEKLSTMAVERATMNTILLANSSFIDKLKGALVWVSVCSVAGGLMTVVWRFIHAYIENSIGA